MNWKLLLVILSITVLIVTAVSFLYLALYNTVINRRLRRNTSKRHRLPAPRVILTIVVALGVIASLCGFTYKQNEHSNFEVTVVHSIFGRIINERQQENSSLAVYGTDDNDGYTLVQAMRSGDYIAKLYVTDGLMTPEHPYWLLFIENPTLDAEKLYFNYSLTAVWNDSGETKYIDAQMLGQERQIYEATNRLLCYGDTTEDTTYN